MTLFVCVLCAPPAFGYDDGGANFVLIAAVCFYAPVTASVAMVLFVSARLSQSQLAGRI